MEQYELLNQYRGGRTITSVRRELKACGYGASDMTVRRWFFGRQPVPLRVIVLLTTLWKLSPEEVRSLLPEEVWDLARLAGWVEPRRNAETAQKDGLVTTSTHGGDPDRASR